MNLFTIKKFFCQNKKFTTNITISFLFFLFLFILWEFLARTNITHSFILPSLSSIITVLLSDFSIILPHLIKTLEVSILGIIIALFFAFLFGIVMDRFAIIHKIVYPIILVFQIVPIIIFAPIFIIWFGYGMGTQLITVVLMVFFPMLVMLKNGFNSTPLAQINLLQTMGATSTQIYRWIKIPVALNSLFSGLRLSITYGITASVISEWVGAIQGLGVIMIRSQKSFLITRVFAINFIIILLSVILYGVVLIIEKKLLPWKKYIYTQ